MTETLIQRLQRAVALRDAATAGPWSTEAIFSPPLALEVCLDYAMPSEGFPILLASTYGDDEEGRLISQIQAERNAAFIAAAPSIVQLAVELGAECERLDARQRRLLKGLCYCIAHLESNKLHGAAMMARAVLADQVQDDE